MNGMQSSRAGRALSAAALVWALGCLANGWAQGVPGKITKTSGQTLEGGIAWKSSAKQYEVAMPGGRAVVPFNQVANVTVAVPAGLEQAIKAVRNGATSGPDVDTLARIVDSYLMLEHDLQAMRWLAEAAIRRGEGATALERYTRVMADRSPDKVPADVARTYWTVLLDADRQSLLREQLDAAIKTGPRPQAASALMLRGELDFRRKEYRDALVEGFLRTVVLFSDVKEVQPEALAKSAKCFDELGESQNAEKMRRKLTTEYPDSPFSK